MEDKNNNYIEEVKKYLNVREGSITYIERIAEWEILIENGGDPKAALEILERLNNGEDVNKVIKECYDSGKYHGNGEALRRMILNISSRGPEFFRATAMNPESLPYQIEEYVKTIERENRDSTVKGNYVYGSEEKTTVILTKPSGIKEPSPEELKRLKEKEKEYREELPEELDKIFAKLALRKKARKNKGIPVTAKDIAEVDLQTEVRKSEMVELSQNGLEEIEQNTESITNEKGE